MKQAVDARRRVVCGITNVGKQCKATTNDGYRCRCRAAGGREYCRQHRGI